MDERGVGYAVTVEKHSIGWALKMMHDGKRVYRNGWDAWLTIVTSNWSGELKCLNFDVPNNDTMPGWKGYEPFIAMYTVNGKLVPWNCSQEDILAVDWNVAPLPLIGTY